MTDAPTRARNPLAFLDAEIEELKAKGTYRRLRVVESEQKSRCVIDGREVITLSSNNYLGLNSHPRLKQAALDATERFGAGSGAVRTIAGTMSIHEQLEARLAEFKHTEAVLTFQSGFTCNTGVIPILAPEGATIVSDALNHASIIDGVRLSKAQRFRYANNDMADLEAKLQEAKPSRFRLIATDGVFSMDGYITNLPAICDLAEKYKIAYLPFLLDKIALQKDLNQADGIHPNPKGTQIMTENVYKELKPLLTK